MKEVGRWLASHFTSPTCRDLPELVQFAVCLDFLASFPHRGQLSILAFHCEDSTAPNLILTIEANLFLNLAISLDLNKNDLVGFIRQIWANFTLENYLWYYDLVY